MEGVSQTMDPKSEQDENALATSDTTPPDQDAYDDSSDEDGEDGVDVVDQAEDPSGVAAGGASDDSLADVVEIHPRRVVEAILFAADSPMPPAKIAKVLGVGDARDVRKHIDRLNEEYEEQGRAFRIEQIASGFQMLTLPAFNSWLSKLLKARQETKLSPAAMETLAIIAYKQPCTRADIEAVRGVAAGDLVNRLREMNLVKIVGRAEDLGRPLLYGTTRRFLEVFGLPSLEDLPQVEALSSGAKAKPQATPDAEPIVPPATSVSDTDDSRAEADAIVDAKDTIAAEGVAAEEDVEAASPSPHLVVHRDDDEDASDDFDDEDDSGDGDSTVTDDDEST